MKTQQQIKDAIFNTTKGSFDFDYCDLLEETVTRIDDYNSEDDIN